MKKILISLLFAIVLLVAGIYIFIPGQLKVSSSVTFHSNREGVSRFLTTDSNWITWWPGKASKNSKGENIFTCKDYDFQITKILYHAFELNFNKNNKSSGSLLKIISLKTDSIGIELETQLNTGSSPIGKIRNYYEAKKIKKCFDAILEALQKHTDSVKEVYGFDIVNEKVQTQFLVSAKKTLPHYPNTQDIYSIITTLRAYIKKHKGKEEYYPMLNIENTDRTNYKVQVALPVNKKLPELGDISSKQMLKDGNILTAEVIGGLNKIDGAMEQFEKYISDYQRSIIAIPFQSLITDRSKEKDSTRWVTKIYYPVV
jgi:hypothetical protein